MVSEWCPICEAEVDLLNKFEWQECPSCKSHIKPCGLCDPATTDCRKCPLDQSAKADAGKPRLSLVPTEIIRAIAKIREYGNQKYKDPDNWKTVEKQRYIDAAYRHWLAYIDGEKKDKESGLPHIWHVACNLAFIVEMERETC